jgi:putative ABC transport system permease protein
MLKNYFKIAFRSLMKHRLFTFINVFGLAFGLALCISVMTYISYENSWEDCHQHKDRIYRIEGKYSHMDTLVSHARVMAPLGNAVLDAVQGIEQVAVFRHYRRNPVEIDNEKYDIGGMIYARPEFFDVFSVPLRVGEPVSALSEPMSILISDSAAGVYFPDQNPVGRVIRIYDSLDCQITGIIEDMPNNTQLNCDFIASYSTLNALGRDMESWERLGTDLTYLLLDESIDPREVEARIPAIAGEYLSPEMAGRYSFSLRPLNEIYFDTYYAGNQGELYPGGEMDIIYMFTAIALFILIQAIANFVNLSTARAADRMKEIGVRKVVGASRSHLIRQFLGESVIITVAAMLIAMGVFHEFFRRGIESILPRQMLADLYTEPTLLLLCLVFMITVGILAGLYPAFYLSRFKPIAVLRSSIGIKSKRSLVRRGLVVFQFTLTIVFIVSTIIIYRQMHFVADMDLGFDKENMLILQLTGDDAGKNCQILKSEIQKQNRVLAAAATDHKLGTRLTSSYGYFTNPECKTDDIIVVKKYRVDHDFIPAFGIEVIQGRGFSPDRPEDAGNGILINESMVKELQIANPIGYRLYGGKKSWEVIGVVRDFHGTSMDWSYRAKSVIQLEPENCNMLAVKLPPDNIPASIAAVKETWENTLPGETFQYSFLQDDISGAYREMNDQLNAFGVLSLVTILIACLGTLGLVTYSAGQKTREIGIRKVLGANVHGIVMMLAREFMLLIAISTVIASPAAYFLMQGFLQEFPFRISLGGGTFAIGGLMALIFALAAAGYQSIKAARANPVESLRYE